MVMSFLKTDGLWRGGRLWTAVRFGVPAGIVFGVIEFGFEGRVGRAAFEALFFGVCLGAWMAFLMWRRWPDAKHLSSGDRVTVVRIVRRGEGLDEARLAPSVLSYATMVRTSLDRAHRNAWILWIFAGSTLILALYESLRGSARMAVIFWVLVVLWAVLLVRVPRQRAQALESASHAELAARQMLGRES
jgi:hypothetical protein